MPRNDQQHGETEPEQDGPHARQDLRPPSPCDTRVGFVHRSPRRRGSAGAWWGHRGLNAARYFFAVATAGMNLVVMKLSKFGISRICFFSNISSA